MSETMMKTLRYIWAARQGHRESMKLLLKQKADTNIGDIDERTPLHVVVLKDNERMTKLLLEH